MGTKHANTDWISTFSIWGTDVYTPTLINSNTYSGTALEVRGSSPTSSINVFGLRTSSKQYIFGDGISTLTNWSSFGGASLSNGDVSSKLPSGISISDIASFRISASAISLLTNSGNVYMLSKGSYSNALFNILGDKSSAETSGSSASATSAGIKASAVNTNTTFTIASKPTLAIGDPISLVNGTSSINGTVKTYSSSTGILTMNISSQNGNTLYTTWTLSYNMVYWHQVKLADGVTPLSGVTKLSISGTGALALTSNGRLYYWGDGNPYNNVTPVAYNYAYDISTAIPSGTNVTDVLVAGKNNQQIYF